MTFNGKSFFYNQTGLNWNQRENVQLDSGFPRCKNYSGDDKFRVSPILFSIMINEIFLNVPMDMERSLFIIIKKKQYGID